MPNLRLPQLSFKLTNKETTAQTECLTSGAKVSATTREPVLSSLEHGLYRPYNISAALHVGKLLGQRLQESGIAHVYLDFNTVYYHGRVKSLLTGLSSSGVVVKSTPFVETENLEEMTRLPHHPTRPLDYFHSSLTPLPKSKRRRPLKDTLKKLHYETIDLSEVVSKP